MYSYYTSTMYMMYSTYYYRAIGADLHEELNVVEDVELLVLGQITTQRRQVLTPLDQCRV